MPMPGESSGRLHCTKEGTVGKHIQGVETRAYNGLGRRIRTRLVAFFLFFFLWSRQTPSSPGPVGGIFFHPWPKICIVSA